MAYCVKNKFEKYQVAPATEKSASTWDNSELYKTSYLCQSLKNVRHILDLFHLILITAHCYE
ncbi:MAG: hypothetical protein MJ252_26095 [archaeon]|nr:hypothetical protein [archaeon]